MSKPQLGGYDFNQELTRIRNATNEINQSLLYILEGNLGLQAIYAHMAKMAAKIGIILDAISNLERIGRNTKNARTEQ